jgi:hypothetical protein
MGDPLIFSALNCFLGTKIVLIPTMSVLKVFQMQNFYADIDTKVTFNQLDNDGCEIECTVHSKKGHLFYDAVSLHRH